MIEQRIESGIDDGDDERAAPAPEKEQDHQRGEAGGDDALFEHAVDGRANENRLIEELA